MNRQPDLLSRLRKQVGIEVALAVAVFVITALLVNAAPPRVGSGAGGIGYSHEADVAGVLAQVVIDPATRGTNNLHIYTLTPAGTVTDVAQVSLTIALPDRGVEPIDIPLSVVSGDHVLNDAFQVPIAGDWLATLTVRVDDFTSQSTQFTIPFE